MHRLPQAHFRNVLEPHVDANLQHLGPVQRDDRAAVRIRHRPHAAGERRARIRDELIHAAVDRRPHRHPIEPQLGLGERDARLLDPSLGGIDPRLGRIACALRFLDRSRRHHARRRLLRVEDRGRRLEIRLRLRPASACRSSSSAWAPSRASSASAFTSSATGSPAFTAWSSTTSSRSTTPGASAATRIGVGRGSIQPAA